MCSVHFTVLTSELDSIFLPFMIDFGGNQFFKFSLRGITSNVEVPYKQVLPVYLPGQFGVVHVQGMH